MKNNQFLLTAQHQPTGAICYLTITELPVGVCRVSPSVRHVLGLPQSLLLSLAQEWLDWAQSSIDEFKEGAGRRRAVGRRTDTEPLSLPVGWAFVTLEDSP